MDRNRTPDVAGTLPPYSADGTPGFFTDEGGGTTVPAQWCNQVTEELRNLLVAAGVSPSPLSDAQLVVALSGALAAISANGIVTTPNKKVVVASTASSAGGTDSAAVATNNSSASGNQSFVAACEDGHASYGDDALLASCHAYVSRAMSVLLASLNASLHQANSIGWGYSETQLESDPGANRNLTGRIDVTTGNVHFKGTLSLGGDVDSGSGALVYADESGNLHIAGNLIMLTTNILANAITGNSDLLIGGNAAIVGYLQAGGDGTFGGKVTAPNGLVVDFTERGSNGSPYTINAPSGEGGTFYVGGSVWHVGDVMEWVVNNNRVGAHSIVFPTAWCSPDTRIACGLKHKGTGTFTVWARNDGADVTDPSVAFQFVVVNPVVPT